MEIPQNVQDKLQCSECNELLSCGPVFLLHETGGAICGRCSQQPDQTDTNENYDRTRIVPYEAVASFLKFPCAFAVRGCPEKVSFTLGQPPHELNCEFRPFICPIAPRGSCDWIGSLSTLKAHCKEKHESNILKNNCHFPRPDLTTSNLQTYLISAFHFLFLFHLKVCVSTGKLFHCVRMFVDSKLLNEFSYSLIIKGNSKEIIESGSIFPPGIMMLQEPSSNYTTINGLLDLLRGKYNETKFTIKIQTLVKLNCLNCSKNIENDSKSKFCEECVKKLVKCKFSGNGCSFLDVNSEKCEKHEKYFCEYQTECCLRGCGVNFVGDSLIEHLVSSKCFYKCIKSNINSVVRLTDSNNYFILFSSNNIGIIICDYDLSDSNLYLYLYTSLPSYELKNYKCSIELTDPRTKHSKILTPQIDYDNEFEWDINEEMDNFPSWNKIGIDVNINLFSNIN